jgi:HD-GYP domain-containing protein (c-di-GMP phosphodiesterase class II)
MPELTNPQVFLLNGVEGMGLARATLHTPRKQRGISDLVGDLQPMQEAADLPDLFAGLAHSVVRTLRADACLVSVYDESRGVLRDVAASVLPPAKLNLVAAEYDLDDFPVTRDVMETNQAAEISVSDESADARERRLLEELGFTRVLIASFDVEGRSFGTVEAYRVEDRPFRSDDSQQIDLLTSFAASAYSRIQLAAKLESHYTETIEALVSALEARDPYTEAHAGRIRDLAMSIGISMQLPAEDRRALRLGAILHDVGKIGISDQILLKPGPLTESEWLKMKEHPVIGERMLQGIDFLAPALPIVRNHHERWDGHGYPDGLAGRAIPVGARIVAVCDAFDAMTSDRPYRQAMSVDDACAELERNAGAQFDAECVAILVDAVKELGSDHLEERFVRFAS